MSHIGNLHKAFCVPANCRHNASNVCVCPGCREVMLKGISTPRGSLQQTGVQTLTNEGGQLKEVICDKAPLTKHEYVT